MWYNNLNRFGDNSERPQLVQKYFETTSEWCKSVSEILAITKCAFGKLYSAVWGGRG